MSALTPGGELRLAADRFRDFASAKRFPADAFLVADLLRWAADSFDCMYAQNSREGIRTRVLPNKGEMAALKLARAINSGEIRKAFGDFNGGQS